MTPTPFFLEELGRENFPFKHLVENNEAIKEALYAEFLQTDLKPNHTLYRRKYFTDKEHEKNMSKIGNFETHYEKRLKQMNLEIYSLQGEEREKYYSHDLDKTPTVIALNSIDENIKTARKEEKAFLSIHAEKIKSTISGLHSLELRNALLNLLSSNNKTLWLTFYENPNEAKDLKQKETLFKAYFKLEEQPQTEVKKKPGKKPVVIKPAQYYLQNIELEERKILFLKELKRNFKGCEPKTFNHLIMVLLEIDVLRKATNKELKVSFENAIEPKDQAQSNFDKSIGSREKGKDYQLFTILKRQVSTIMEEKQVV